MSTPFTNKSVRKTSLSSLLQQRAGLTTIWPIILCPKNSSDVFQPLDGSQGVANNFGQNQSAASSNSSSVPLPCHNKPLAKTTIVMEAPPQSLLQLYLLVHYPFLSQPTVVLSINILLFNLLVLCLPFPTPIPTTSCLFQMQMFLLAVRPAQAQSNRRSMDHQLSYQLARNSRSFEIASRTY